MCLGEATLRVTPLGVAFMMKGVEMDSFTNLSVLDPVRCSSVGAAQ